MRRKILALLCAVLLCITVFAGCVQNNTPQETEGAATPKPTEEIASASPSASASPVVVTDMSGNTVTVDSAEKIVSLTPAGTEIVCALGAEDKLVGVDDSSDYPRSVDKIEVVGDFNGPDIEKIVALEPDVVLAGNMLQHDEIDQLTALGITVVSIEATAFEDIKKSITMVGKILDASQEANKINKKIDEALKEAEENKPEKSPTVYYAMSYGDMGNWTSGPGSFINSMIEAAGGTCVTADAQASWLEYSLEDLVAANPDIILVDSSMGSAGDIENAPGYEDLDAVKKGHVYIVDADVFTRPGPRIAEAVKAVSEIVNQ
ncbi:MAG: ABC transporter substrate-binding protein [Christensenella sp.]|nr:ABC transporter substrate-binding protein [Christensenella sp.]